MTSDKTVRISLKPTLSSKSIPTTSTSLNTANSTTKKMKSRPSAAPRQISVRSIRHHTKSGKVPSLKEQQAQEATATWLVDTLSFWFADAMEVAFFGPYDEVR